jgi:pilus assembly protein Flp/PilA
MQKLVLAFIADDDGATAIEYALIAVGVSVAVVATVQGLGTSINNLYGLLQPAFK